MSPFLSFTQIKLGPSGDNLHAMLHVEANHVFEINRYGATFRQGNIIDTKR